MTTTLESALALAIAKAALAGDAATVRRLLEACEQGRDVETFADTSGKGRWSMKGLVSWLTGKKAAEKRHASEHERQRREFQPDEVLPAASLTESERKVYYGELVHLISSNLYSIRYNRGDGSGSNTSTFVTFRDGSVYELFDVPFDVVMKEIESDSPGRTYWRLFREGSKPFATKYRYRKVGTLQLTKKEAKTPVIHILSLGKKKS
jgi:hypothetical protein